MALSVSAVSLTDFCLILQFFANPPKYFVVYKCKMVEVWLRIGINVEHGHFLNWFCTSLFLAAVARSQIFKTK